MENEIIKFDYNPLRGRIREILGSESLMASKLGIDKSTLSLKLNGKLGFSQDEIYRSTTILNIPLDLLHQYFFKILD